MVRLEGMTKRKKTVVPPLPMPKSLVVPPLPVRTMKIPILPVPDEMSGEIYNVTLHVKMLWELMSQALHGPGLSIDD